jgi:hypothetical protein
MRPENEPRLAHRKEALQVVDEMVEIDERHFACFVETVDAIGNAPITGGRRPVTADGYFDRHNAGRGKIADGITMATVEEAGGQVKQEVDNPRRRRFTLRGRGEELAKRLVQPRAHALQAGGACEKRIENRRPHGRYASFQGIRFV